MKRTGRRLYSAFGGQMGGFSRGSSLMEMVIVLAILSLLAVVAAPYARKSIKREKELELRETLRAVRNALDRFHLDFEGEASQKTNRKVSKNGYPLSLQTLVEGLEISTGGKKIIKRYLRALPSNPIAAPGTPFEAQWTFVPYQLETPLIASSSYGTTLAEAGMVVDKDIYDLHAVTPEIALNGTRYADW